MTTKGVAVSDDNTNGAERRVSVPGEVMANIASDLELVVDALGTIEVLLRKGTDARLVLPALRLVYEAVNQQANEVSEMALVEP